MTPTSLAIDLPMAINYALDELLHWDNQNSPLNGITAEFRMGKLSKNLLQDASINQSNVFDEMLNLLNKIVLISIYEGNRRFKSEVSSDESLKLTDECNKNEFESTATTVNVIVPIYLENLKYPRMLQLFSQKSSREVLLAVAFVISKNNLFQLVDKKCSEVINLTKHIAYNVSLIANSNNCITLDDISKEFVNQNDFKAFLNSIFEKIDFSNFSANESPITTGNESNDNTNKNCAKGGRFLKNKILRTGETDSTKRFNQSKMEALSYWIESALAFQNELTKRAVILATPKGCKDYDTERLRVGFEMVDMRMDTRNDAILAKYANSSSDTTQHTTSNPFNNKNVSEVIENDECKVTEHRKISLSSNKNKRSSYAKCTTVPSVDTKCDNNSVDSKILQCEIANSLPISSLADQIIQLQNKLRSLSSAIYRKDKERSSMFSRAATQFKAHKGSVISDKLNKCEGDKSVHIKPSPLEYVLISDDNSFETNMALLAVISRSLISEFTRHKFWNLAKMALVGANKLSISSNPGKSGISVGIYKVNY